MISKPSLAVPPWADAGDAIQPDVAYIASGFPHSNDKPTRQTMNWVLNYATNGVQYLTARGIPDWDSAQTYTAGDVVRFQGRFYSALQSNNTNRSPAVQTSWWALWYVFPADLNTLYITPAQVAASYLTTNQANATFASTANLTTATQNLQNQINAIVAVTGAGYRAGNGISIDTNNFISFNPLTANLPTPDWNATSGGGAILNKPVFHIVATSGSYNDLLNRPTFATVAMSGRYNDLVGLPSLAAVATSGDYNSLINRPTIPAAQVNSDWNAASGVAAILNKPTIPAGQVSSDWNAASGVSQILNKPPLTVVGGTVMVNAAIAPSQSIYIESATQSTYLNLVVHDGSNPYIQSSTGLLELHNTALNVYGNNLSLIGNAFAVIRSDSAMWLNLNVQGTHPVFDSTSGRILSNTPWEFDGGVDCKNVVVHATGTGVNLLNISNDGSFGYPDPYLWSGTGTFRIFAGLVVHSNTILSGLTMNADIRCDNNHVYAAGYQGRAGLTGGFEGQAFNIYWTGAAAQLWIDVTNVGNIALTSDYRLKENVNLLASALPLVMRLRPVTFNWKSIPNEIWQGDSVVHAGFLAHEVQDVFWGAADGKKDERTSDGKIQPQHLNQIDIVALLTRAMQELSEKVSQLENKMQDIHPELN